MPKTKQMWDTTVFQEERESITSRETSSEKQTLLWNAWNNKVLFNLLLIFERHTWSSEAGMNLREEKQAGTILVLKIAYLVLVSALESMYNKVQSKESELS